MTEAEQIMKRCQAGTRNYNEANNLHAACYGMIGKLLLKIKELESQEPVAWLLTEKNINSLQVDSIQLLINRLKHAHHTDLCVRINGQDEWFQADWLKHMVRATPPQRPWVGLTDEERNNCLVSADPCEALAEPEARQLIEDVEQALKGNNSV